MPDRDIEMRARAREVVREVVGLRMRNDAHISFEDAVSACLAFAATSAVAADGEVIKHAWNAGYTTGRNHADDPPFAGLGKHNRQHGWELYACSLTDRNLAALSASPLPGREEIARAEVARLHDGWDRVSRALDNIEGGMHADLEDAAAALWTDFEEVRASLSTPPTEG